MIGRQMAVDRQWQNEKINLFFLLYATALYIWWKRDLSWEADVACNFGAAIYKCHISKLDWHAYFTPVEISLHIYISQTSALIAEISLLPIADLNASLLLRHFPKIMQNMKLKKFLKSLKF